jgi:predicted transcriptional regulator
MEALCDLLFELSNEDRLQILQGLEKGPKNLIKIAKELDNSVQGTSRNVARLVEASIIRRNPNGEYELTSYGNVSLKLLCSYEFLSRNRSYFLSHDASILPCEFINRLGELSTSSIQGDFVTNYVLEGDMLKEAEEYFYATGDQFNVHAKSIIADKLNQGLEIRTIFPEAIIPPPGFRPAPGPNRRLLPKVHVAITVTDKKAFLGLPLLDGKFDPGVRFVSEDPKFRKWCLDLFNYYWEQAKPIIGPFPNLS